jgi:hypothetical protein
MMNLISFDFHAARMLGLGYIDSFSGSQKYIYLAEYLNEELINPDATSAMQHLYISLPTGQSDSRLPAVPVPATTTYGINFEDNSENPPKITDENGYSLYEDARYINLNVSNSVFHLPLGDFNPGGSEFSLGASSVPVFSSAYYREQGGSWLVPDDLKDPEYQNSDASDEIVLLPYRNDTLLTHKLIEEGIFEYALYSINWFARPSDLSSAISTGQTTFPVRNTLIPPGNVQSVYIQEEDPLLITSQYDQDRLSDFKTIVQTSNPNGDYGLTRVCFEWNESHNSAYPFANKVEFLFKEQEPDSLSGVIKSISTYGTDKLKIQTSEYTQVLDNTTISPQLNFGSNEHEKFLGSYFISNQNQYPIVNIEAGSGGDGPIITILKIKAIETKNEASEGDYKPVIKYTVPNKGDLFTIPQNMNNDESWDSILSKQVEIIQFSSTTEPIKTGDTTSKEVLVGGIIETVTISEILDGVNSTGAYELIFSGNPLTAHPDSSVTWYKGSVRVPSNNDPNLLRSIEVWQINTDNSDLKLVVYDPLFEDTDLQIETGAGIDIQFHPGYRVYLEPETGFGRDEIVPIQGERIRKTLIAARSLDTSRSYSSSVCTPLLLMGREIIESAQASEPLGALFASRPDFFGMSSFSFTTQVNTTGGRVPYGYIFCKTHDGSILSALYKAETIETIYASLPDPKSDEWFANRWYDLVNVITENDEFKVYGGYGFPYPDNDDTNPDFDGITAPGTIAEDIQAIIRSVFIAMTKQPVVYDHVKNLSNHPVSPSEPKLRKENGELLLPNDPLFDPFPMLRKYVDSGNTYLKFVDYKLDGASNSWYFYYAVEFDSNLRVDFSKCSPISKPVRLLNVKPAAKPGIREVYTVSANPYLEILPGVQFDINPYLPDEGIARIKIYRSLNHANAVSIRNMDEVKTVEISEPIIDNFDDLPTPPFGEPIYYRLVAVRIILNEDDQEEEICSQPSDMVMANVIDVLNPEAPELNYSIGSTSSNPETLNNVELSWEETTYKGKYYLYKSTSSGNWQLVQQYSYTDDLEYSYTTLEKEDSDGDIIYHRFKVVAENPNGLLSLDEKVTVV